VGTFPGPGETNTLGIEGCDEEELGAKLPHSIRGLIVGLGIGFSDIKTEGEVVGTNVNVGSFETIVVGKTLSTTDGYAVAVGFWLTKGASLCTTDGRWLMLGFVVGKTLGTNDGDPVIDGFSLEEEDGSEEVT
jgi:hypothetical protein